MALVKGRINNLEGGISKQAATLRLPSQSEDEVNTWPDVIDGLTRRPPSEFWGLYPWQAAQTAFTYHINRDEWNQYSLVIQDGNLVVMDLDGNWHSVIDNTGGDGYLSVPAGTENASFSALAIADYTFITNNTVPVLMNGDVAPGRPPGEALVNVIEGNYARTYSVTLNGWITASYTTNDGSVATDALLIDTNIIASTLAGQLWTAIAASGDPGWAVTAAGNTIQIVNWNNDFSISGTDGFSNNAMKVLKGTTQLFTDLPATAPPGFTIAIFGDTTHPDQTYYLKFVSTAWPNPMNWVYTGASGSTWTLMQWGAGYWQECPQPGIQINFDPTTMPHTLVNNGDGTFTFDVATWDPRVAGDDNSIQTPSFVGQTIGGVAFFQDRLGLLTQQNIVWSGVGDFFNFWRASAVTLLESDPIDINAATTQVSLLRHGVMYQGSYVLWSDQNQFNVSGNSSLTPQTATMIPVSTYENLSADVAPVSSVRRTFFAFDRNTFVGIGEWYYDIYYHLSLSDDITEHVATLIPQGVYRFINTDVEQALFVLSTGDPSSVWVYKYLWENTDKKQSAWTRWQFPGATIIDGFYYKDTLYLTVNRGGDMRLEKLRLTPSLTDPGGVPVTFLDSRVDSTWLPAPVYDPDNDQTTYLLPYTPPSDGSFVAIAQAGSDAAPQFMNGTVLAAGTPDGAVVLQGDTTGYPLWFGTPFTTTYTFSPLYYRDTTANSVIQEGKLQLLKLDVSFQNTGYFRVEITPSGRSTKVHEYCGWQIGDALPDVDSPPAMRTTVRSFPVFANNEKVLIQLINDTALPSSFTRVEWKGNFVPKTRK